MPKGYRKDGSKLGFQKGYNKGGTLSIETRRKISKSHKGLPSWSKGLKMSKEFCLKNSLAHKGLQVGSKNSRWKGGLRKSATGYMLVHKPDHPFSYEKGYILRSRLVMGKHLGRYLSPKEVVHHKNDIKDDDRISNLRLFACQANHARFHDKERIKDDNNRYSTKL